MMRVITRAVSVIFFFMPLLLYGLLVTDAVRSEEDKPCPKPYIKIMNPRSGSPGDEVQVIGASLGSAEGTVIFFPGFHGEIISWENEKLLVRVPDEAESGMVWIYVPCGQHSNEQYFTVKSPDTPKQDVDNGLTDKGWEDESSDDESTDEGWEYQTSDDGLTDKGWEDESSDDESTDEGWEYQTSDDGLTDKGWEDESSDDGLADKEW